MTPKLTPLPASIVAPRGFRTAGVFCDIKRLGTGKGSDKGDKRDLALIVSDVPATVAGMFTTNQVCAAPVRLCIERVRAGRARAIVVNSGNANACTGRTGMANARAMTRATADALGLTAVEVLAGSTGRIGVQLPMERVARGIQLAVAVLGATTDHADGTAEAIMTSDTRHKQVAFEFGVGPARVRIGGICKGAGMIQPGMSPTGRRPAAVPAPGTRGALHATMLCFLTTDAAIAPAALRSALRAAVATSFNRITVDGDMSTNDTVLVLANGSARNPRIATTHSPGYATFAAALARACLDLALMIVRDGEGVHRVVTVRVAGAQSFADADAGARAIANSALVKTSWHGGDPNWGRILDALGYSAARVVEERVDIGYSAPGSRRIVWSLRRGQPTAVPFPALWHAVQAPEFDLHVRLGLGRHEAVMYAADLTEAYVDFNKGTIADPGDVTALGG
jgi:glutamate N-acetyltransferase/amino-acid N-acetyltransferase